MEMKHKKVLKTILIAGSAFVVAAGMDATVSLSYFVGFPKTVGDRKYEYSEEVIWIVVQKYGLDNLCK